MNTLVTSLGPAVLAELRDTAEGIGCSDLAPASIVYYLGPKTGQAYDPDTYDGTFTWTQTATITDALVGGFNWNVVANVQNVERSDIQVLFAQASLTTAPTDDDECTYASQTYQYVGHKAAVDLYLVHMRLKTGAQ